MWYSSIQEKRKSILKIIILSAILILIMLFLFYLCTSESSSLKNNLNKDNEQNKKDNAQNKLETLLGKIQSNLTIMESSELSEQKFKINQVCDDILQDLKNIKKEQKMKSIFDKAFNYFKTQEDEANKIQNYNNASLLRDIAKMIKTYQTNLEEFLNIKAQCEMRKLSQQRGVQNQEVTQPPYSKEELDTGRNFLLHYAYILKYYTEDIPNIQKEMSNIMNESQQQKLKDLEKQIWSYMQALRKATLKDRKEHLPKMFADIGTTVAKS